MKRISFFIGVVSLLLASQAHAGWVITEQTTNQYGNKTLQTTFLQGKYIRFETETLVSIFNVKEDKIILLFPQDKAYWEGTAKQLRLEYKEMMARQIQMMIKIAPDDQKDTLRKAYNAMMSAADTKNDSLPIRNVVKLIKTDSASKLLGYPVQLYQVLSDSVLVEKIWFTNAVKPYADIALKNAFHLINAVDPLSNNVDIPVSDDYYQLLTDGVILKRILLQPGKKSKVSTVVELRKVKIVETLFEIPANYLLMSIQQVLHMDMNKDILTPKLSPDNEKRIQLSVPPPFKEKKNFPSGSGINL